MNPFIKTAEDLVTPREQTRAGFIAMALEKNLIAVPYVEEAKALKALAAKVSTARELLTLDEIRVGLLTASGLSDKALNYLTEDDKTLAISGLIEEFLEPAGDAFVDELVYRFLLTRGDALGGKARNLAGLLGERKFLRTLLSLFNLSGVQYKWKDNKSSVWLDKPDDDTGIEKEIKALYWKSDLGDRLLIMNINVPSVSKNVDVTILNCKPDQIVNGKSSAIYEPKHFVSLGELKGGIDPAGADEHWKTANSALARIRSSFGQAGHTPNTFFIGAAIENAMAVEIFAQLQNGTLSNAANLHADEQLTSVCDWILNS